MRMPGAMTEAVRLDPTSFDARYGLAKIMFGLGQLDGAEAEAIEAIRLRAHSPAARELLERIREARWRPAD